MDAKEVAKKILDVLAEDYDETYVSSGYAYYADAKKLIAAALEAYAEEQLEAERLLRHEWGYRIECLEKQLSAALAEGRRAGILLAASLVEGLFWCSKRIYDGEDYAKEIRALITTPEANEGEKK